MTIAGASSGNGMFDLSNITRWILVTGPVVDLTTELVGQPGFLDFNLGAGGGTPGAPIGVDPFLMQTTRGLNGDRLGLRSMKPVPVPSTLLLMGSGLVGLLGWNYRRAKKA